MSNRKERQIRVNSVQVSATLDRELYDFVDQLTMRRQVRSRSHALNLGLECLKWMIANNPEWFFRNNPTPLDMSAQLPQQSRPPQPEKDQRFPY